MNGVVSQVVDRKISAFIERSLAQIPDEDDLNRLALEIFAYQFEYNPAYRMFCLQRRMTPDRISSWEHIPAVPATAFKSRCFAGFPPERAVRIFETSGTTQAEKGRHYFDTLNLYEESAIPNFSRHLLPDSARLPMRMLLPPPHEAPASSLVYMCQTVARMFSENVEWFIHDGRLNIDALCKDLELACETGEYRMLLGTSYAFVHFFDALRENRKAFGLPPGSRIMETGGTKGKSREISREEFSRLTMEFLGVPDPWIVNEYGMTELTSQMYDNTLRQMVQSGASGPRVKTPPPWMRVRIVDPVSGEYQRDGVPGIIRIWDIANRGSAVAIQTDDIGVWETGGLRVAGRVRGSDSRGCGRAADEMLSN